MEYIKNPHKIENGSMAIIESEMKDPSTFSELELPIVKRVIHTTADFEYEDLVRFGGDVIEESITQVAKGCKIYCDTNMIGVGVNRILLKKFACEMVNYVHDDDVRAKAKELGITRSMVAMEKAFFDDEIGIYMIGNAPTALIKLIELSEEHNVPTGPVIGVPVGFVGARESKDLLMEKEIPYISVEGRKGGSTVAVAMMNAMLKIYDGRCK